MHVASATHDRKFENHLVQVTGTGIASPLSFTGSGAIDPVALTASKAVAVEIAMPTTEISDLGFGCICAGTA